MRKRRPEKPNGGPPTLRSREISMRHLRQNAKKNKNKRRRSWIAAAAAAALLDRPSPSPPEERTTEPEPSFSGGADDREKEEQRRKKTIFPFLSSPRFFMPQSVLCEEFDPTHCDDIADKISNTLVQLLLTGTRQQFLEFLFLILLLLSSFCAVPRIDIKIL